MNPRTPHLALFYAFVAVALLAWPIGGCSRKSTDESAKKPQAERSVPEQKKPEPMFAKPEAVKGLYLTAWSAGSTRKLDNVIPFLKKHDMNALVIDVRDAGINYFKMGVEPAKSAGAEKIAVRDPKKLMERLKKEGVYPIARIACFRDSFVPQKRKDRAVVTPDGALWKDRAGYTWLDPYNSKNWEMLGEIVQYALDLGFPEIQLDYVRFPSEGKQSTMVFPSKKDYPEPEAQPTQVVAAFARTIRERTHKAGAVLSADIFGIVSSGGSDQGIGQELETIAEPFDLICPMVYPSHFAKGEYGVRDPNQAPYKIVAKSLRDYARKLPNMKLRPWLQDFSLGVKYGAKQVEAQIKAAKDTGYSEYLLWNPVNRYTERPSSQSK